MLTEDVLWDRKGRGVAAASGVDIALWDVAGKYHEEPVYRLLGGDASGEGSVKAYASDLFWDDPETMGERAAGYVDRGFAAVKTHLGRGIDADEARVAAMSEAIGDVELMVDMNCGYDRADALRAGRMLEEVETTEQMDRRLQTLHDRMDDIEQRLVQDSPKMQEIVSSPMLDLLSKRRNPRSPPVGRRDRR